MVKTLLAPKVVTESNAKRIGELLKKKKKLIRERESTVEFKEPCAILIRRTGKGEWMEDCTKGKLEIEHSDGTERYLYLEPNGLVTLPYGDKGIRMYILHEDYPLPLNIASEPIITSETLTQIIQKTIHDLQELQAKKYGAIGDMIWKIGLAAGVVILAYAVYTILRPEQAIAPEVVNNATALAQNITNITRIIQIQ